MIIKPARKKSAVESKKLENCMIFLRIEKSCKDCPVLCLKDKQEYLNHNIN